MLQRVVCKTLEDLPGLGFLLGTEGNDMVCTPLVPANMQLSANTRIELPLWLATSLTDKYALKIPIHGAAR